MITSKNTLAVAAVALALAAPAAQAQSLGNILGGIVGNGNSAPPTTVNAQAGQDIYNLLTSAGMPQNRASQFVGNLGNVLSHPQSQSVELQGEGGVRFSYQTADLGNTPRGHCARVQANWMVPGQPQAGVLSVIAGYCYHSSAEWLADGGNVNGRWPVVAVAQAPAAPPVAQQRPTPAAPAAAPAPKTPNPPPASMVEAMDETWTAAKAGSLRPDTTTDFPAVASFKTGDNVAVVGRVKGGKWLKAQINGQTGYVMTSTLTDPAAAKAAAEAKAKKEAEAKAAADAKAKAQADAKAAQTPAPAPVVAPTIAPASSGAAREAIEAQQPKAAPAAAPVAQPAPAPAAAPVQQQAAPQQAPAAPAPAPAPAKPAVKTDL